MLPDWIAGDATLTVLIPFRQGLLPSVRAFIEHLAVEFPNGCHLIRPISSLPLNVGRRRPLRVDAVEKGFCGDLRATLIQEQMRNLDSKNQSPGVVRFNF